VQTLASGLAQDVESLRKLAASDTATINQETDKTGAAVQSSITDSRTKLVQEIDQQTAALTALLAKNHQDVLDTLGSDFSTQQTQYQAGLKLSIENALADGVTEIQFALPASRGGYLDSTPVGVQEVVTDDVQVAQELGIAITPSAVRSLQQADTELTNKKYFAAYADYMKSYEALANSIANPQTS
jgi:hypothetical protein